MTNLFGVDIPIEGMDQMNRILEFEIINREDLSSPVNILRSLKDVAPNTHAFKSNHSLDAARKFVSLFFTPSVQFRRCYDFALYEFELNSITKEHERQLPFLPMFVMEIYTQPPDQRRPFKKCISKHDIFSSEDVYPGQLHCIAVDLRPNRNVILDDMQSIPVPFTLDNFQSTVKGKNKYGIHSLYQAKLSPVSTQSSPTTILSSGGALLSRIMTNDCYLRNLKQLVETHLKDESLKMAWICDARSSTPFQKSKKPTCAYNSIKNLFGLHIPRFMMNIAARISEFKILNSYIKRREITQADRYLFAAWCKNLWSQDSWPLDVAMEVAGNFFNPRVYFKKLSIKDGNIDRSFETEPKRQYLPMFLIECYATRDDKRKAYHKTTEEITLTDDEVIGPLHCISVDMRKTGDPFIYDCKLAKPIPYNEKDFIEHVNVTYFGIYRAYQVCINK